MNEWMQQDAGAAAGHPADGADAAGGVVERRRDVGRRRRRPLAAPQTPRHGHSAALHLAPVHSVRPTNFAR